MKESVKDIIKFALMVLTGLITGILTAHLISQEKSQTTQALLEYNAIAQRIKQLEEKRLYIGQEDKLTDSDVKEFNELTSQMINLFFTYLGLKKTEINLEKMANKYECPLIEGNGDIDEDFIRKRITKSLKNKYELKIQRLEKKLHQAKNERKNKKDNLALMPKRPEDKIKYPEIYYKQVKTISKKNLLFESIMGSYEGTVFLKSKKYQNQNLWRVNANINYHFSEGSYKGEITIILINEQGETFSRKAGDGDNKTFSQNLNDPNAIVIEAAPDLYFRLVPTTENNTTTLNGTAYEKNDMTKSFEYIGKVKLIKLTL